MTPVIIADETGLANARRKSARVLTFEDGMTRHITLTGRQWANYDVCLMAGYTAEQLHWVAFDTAREAFENGSAPDFEEELRQCFVQMVTHSWTMTKQGRRQDASNFAPSRKT